MSKSWSEPVVDLLKLRRHKLIEFDEHICTQDRQSEDSLRVEFML